MCIGLFALFDKIAIPGTFNLSIILIASAALVHFVSVAILGRLPRLMGLAFTGAYGYFLYMGMIQ